MEEGWRQIEEFPGFSVSDQGRVRNDVSERILSTNSINQAGVRVVPLRLEGSKQYTRSIGVLVAKAFLEPDPRGPEYMTVIYLDGDRGNTRASNLAYRSRPFAIDYHQQFEYYKFHRKLNRNGIIVPVRDVDTGVVYPNTTEACMAHGLLERFLVLAIFNNERVFPTNQLFVIHKD